MWVRSEYANELAVLAAWVSVLVPWNVTRHRRTDELSLLGGLLEADAESKIFFLRFPFVEFQLRRPGGVNPDDIQNGSVEEGSAAAQQLSEADASGVLDSAYAGTELIDGLFVTTPPTSLTFYEGTLWQASILWTVASAAFACAFVLSLALYFREESVAERLPVSAVRLMGTLLGVGALGTGGATVLYFLERDIVGFPVPAGVIVVGILAAVLLQTEEVAGEEDQSDDADG
jgi:hypothetical protein